MKVTGTAILKKLERKQSKQGKDFYIAVLFRMEELEKYEFLLADQEVDPMQVATYLEQDVEVDIELTQANYQTRGRITAVRPVA